MHALTGRMHAWCVGYTPAENVRRNVRRKLPQKRLWAVWVEQIDLSLSLNEIGNAGAAVIAEGLKCNLSLAQLHLEGCGITETGPCAIINAHRDTWQAQTQLADATAATPLPCFRHALQALRTSRRTGRPR